MEVIDKDGKLDSTVQNNFVATLLSYVVFHLFCKSPEHNTYRMNSIRSRDYAMKKLKLKNQQVEVRHVNFESVVIFLFRS